MAKTKISEFSTTPGNNTDINGINISEGCAPSGINNAIRELMSDLKEWQSGAMDVYVIPQGTAAAPGIQLYGDLDTGLYGYAANQLGVAVGGASAGYFSSAGWNGNVNGTITGDINATTIDTTNLEVTNIKAKDGTAAITIADSTGVVSVSTTLDLTTVEVTNIKAKDGTAAIALTDSTGVVTLARTTSATNSVNEMLVLEHYSTGTISAGFGSGIKFFGENTGGGNSVYAAIHAVWEGGIGDPSGGALVFLTDGYVGDNTERVRITSEGKVGIGTATPSTTLEVAGSATVTGATTLSATTQNIALGTSQTTGTWTAGGASQTGALTLDQSTKTHTLNLGTGATESGLTKTVNIGTGGVSTSTTAINIGSANGTSTTLNGTVTAATLNSTTIDTTNIEVTNIKAKDGTAALSIADSTGAVTVATAFAANGGATLGDASGDALTINSSAVSTPNGLNFDSDTFVIDAANNRVGIGAASPAKQLDLAANNTGITTGDPLNTLRFTDTDITSAAGQPMGRIEWFSADTDTAGVKAYIQAQATDGSPDADMVFATNHVSGGGTAERMRIQYDGNVGIGTNAPVAQLQVNRVGDGTYASTLAESRSKAGLILNPESTGSSVALNISKAVGGNAIIYQPTNSAATTAYDNIFNPFGGNVGIGTVTPTNKLTVDGNANVTGNTTLGDASTDTVTVNGYMAVGGALNSGIAVRIGSSALGGATQRGAYADVTFTSASTTRGAAFESNPSTAVASFTVTDVMGFSAQNVATLGAGSTITNQHGVYVNDQTRGTNNFGVTSLVSSGTNKWNIYASGTAANYFAGNVLVGTTASLGTAGVQAAAVATDPFEGYRFGANANGPTVSLYKNRGATVGTNAVVVSGDELGTIAFRGYDGAAYRAGAFITGNVDGTPGASDMPGRLTFSTTADGAATPTERMRLDSSGNLGLGVTPAYKLDVFSGANNSAIARFTGAQSAKGLIVSTYASNGNDGGANLASTDSISLSTASTERMRITSSGNVKIGGSAERATTVGTNHLDIFNGTAPVGTLSNGISIYSSAGEAYVMDAAGNATLFSPHDKETNEWIFKSKHTPTGKVLKIDVEKLLRFVNNHFGLDAIQEFIEE